MRKPFIIIGFIILSIAIGVVIYFLFFREFVTGPENVNNANANIGGFPVSNGNVNRQILNFNVNAGPGVNGVAGNINGVLPQIDTIARGGKTLTTDVTGVPAQDASLGKDGRNLNFYEKNTGIFYEIGPDGKSRKELTDQRFPNAEKIVWSPDGSTAIVTFPDDTKISYNFNTKEQVTLPREWDDIKFSDDSGKIGFKNLAASEDERWLAIADPDGSGVQLIEPIGDKGDDVQVAWSPTNQVVALFREGVSASDQEIFFIGLHGENFKSFVADGRGFEGSWSANGDRLLYNVYNADSEYKPTLWIVDGSGDNIGRNEKDLGVQTWASKCAFSGNNVDVYCAVPGSLPEGAALYPEIAANIPDTFYKINTQTGLKTLLADPVNAQGYGSYTVTSPMLSEGEQYLYFTDTQTGKVYQIQLK